METPWYVKLAIVGFCVLMVGLLFLYHYLQDRTARRKKEVPPP